MPRASSPGARGTAAIGSMADAPALVRGEVGTIISVDKAASETAR